MNLAVTASTPSAPHAAMLPPALERIILVGFMGAGKTTVGRRIARSLDWEFLDLDVQLETRAGATIAEIFATQGEEHFRRLESASLASALGGARRVIALGGGTPERLTNRLLIEQTPGTKVVFLDAPFPALYDRCMLEAVETMAQVRPLMASANEAEARFRQRQPIYRRLASVVVPTSELRPEEITERLLTHFSR